MAVDQPSARKVKLLCSFGGEIIPRPSDGVLRYVGGQTRIITVRRDATLPEITHKMADAFGGPVAIRYQLPDVDLDALVSVSSPEDLENMMEEYDRIAEAAPDGSAKLRVFLFSPSDFATDLNLFDTGQRYVDAVNGISTEGSLRRKDSLASATSTQNSDAPQNGTDAVANCINEGMSSAILSPTAAASHDPSSLFFLGTPPPMGFPDAQGLPANPTQLEMPHSAPTVPQSYVDQNQTQYINPQSLGISAGSLPVNVVALPPHSVVPHAVHISTAPVASQVGNVKSVAPKEDLYMKKPYAGRTMQLQSDPNYKAPYQPQENPYGGRTTQIHSDPNYKAPYQHLSQLPPLPPTYLQPQNVERYGLHMAVPPLSQGNTLRLEDCFMCQKALPHAHSDTLIQEHGNGSGSAAPEASTRFHSHHSEDATRLQALQRVVTRPLAENMVGPNSENMVSAGQFSAYGFTQIPDTREDSERLVLPNADNFNHGKVLSPQGTSGLPSGIQSSYGMFVNIPQSRREDSLQQQLPQSDYVRPIDGIMEALHVNPFENPGLNEKSKPVVPPIFGVSKELKPENPPMFVDNSSSGRPQVGGNTIIMGNALANTGIVPEGNYVIAKDQSPSSSLGFVQFHNLQPAIPSQVSTSGAYLFSQETGAEPMFSKQLHGLPAYSCGIDPTYNNNVINNVPIGDWKDESSLYRKDELNDLAALPSGKALFQLPNSTGPTGHVERFQEPIPSDSLFCNQDPRKILGNMNLLPPRPARVASRESVMPKDFPTDKGSDIAVLLEEGVFHQSPNSLNKDSSTEPSVRATRGSAEEQIKQDLQAVAEGVAASVLQPSVRATRGSAEEQIKQDLQAVAEGVAASVLQPSVPPVPVFVARETKEPPPQSNKERGVIEESASSQNAVVLGNHRIGDIKTKQIDKMNLGFPIGDEIGRLQIIKNSDLEELRELGSGTFGTVYHGKWRGSDVAIKRINDRCFAGKPSEQERMRADFWNEACKLADLHHPNVLAFYGVVLDGPGGTVATVTEYMVNGSLRRVLHKNDKTLDHRKRLLIAMDVAFGMEYLHGKNIVHFDLKSDNLLVNLSDPQRPICKVGDLGLSKVKCQTLISGGVRGTLPWMAPELLNGSSNLVSEKVDVFSFGIVMWEILTGEEPYADLHYGAIIGGIVSNTLRPPVPESCDPEWRSLMEKCWSSEPSERPSFTEIANRLRAMAASPPPKGRTQEQPTLQA